ncbi:cupin domain-containing protein [Halorarum halophilum]|uniref:Cupin domain-containing protein n=1 Tax=Halorarum halophilum TaxID=2743090 RepID=A0A7D5KGB5_9EURY|nr:cupin domain-containing protein [Halobaculum halophilum]
MKPVDFDEAETYEPDEGWQRRALAGSDQFSFEWFEKPPGHSSPMHDHGNEQVCMVLRGELTIHTEDDSVTLGQYDSVLLESSEPHRVENTGDELAVGLDVFAPGRSFDFWTDREDDAGDEEEAGEADDGEREAGE